MNFIPIAQVIFGSLSAATSVLAVVGSLLGAIVSYRKLRNSPNASGEITPSDIRQVENFSSAKNNPFEIAALSRYYNQALGRANAAFIFSITFASIGFGVIIFAFLSHNASDISDSIVKVISGTVIDAVSGLFFVQSTNAQKHMSDFFEKLRLDRLNVEARDMINEIENSELRDDLRAQLVLKYSGIDASAKNVGNRSIGRRKLPDVPLSGSEDAKDKFQKS